MDPAPGMTDRVAACVLVVLAALAVWESTRWPPASVFAGDPTILPRALAGLMVATALALWVFASRGGEARAPGMIGRTLAAIGATLALAACLPLLGVIGAGAPYLLALQRLAGAPWRPALATAAATPVVIWLAFAKGLNVPLPSGTLWAAIAG